MCRFKCEALGKTPEQVELLGDGQSLHSRAQPSDHPQPRPLPLPLEDFVTLLRASQGVPETEQGHCVKNMFFKKYL